MGKSELVFTMTQVEHKAAVKVDKSPDGPRVVVQLRVQGAWPRPIRVRAQPLLCKLGGLRLAGARAWPRRFYPMGGRGRVGPVLLVVPYLTDNHASTPPLTILHAGCSTNSVEALMANVKQQSKQQITDMI